MRRVAATVRGAMGLLVAGVALSMSPTASAQSSPPSGNKVAAEALFEDARTLMSAGKFAEACPKFAGSQRLDPSPSTLLNLANCWEKVGRLASAWATYREAESAANAAKRPDYVAAAQRHAEALAPKLARLTVSVAQPPAGLQVTRDGLPVAAAEWGVPIPIDAGTHNLEASAPGYKSWSGKVDVSQEGAQVTVPVPALEALPPEATPPPPPQPSAPAPAAPPVAAPEPASHGGGGNGQRVLGAVVGGAGVVGIGVSLALGLVANGKKNDSLRYCPTSPNACAAAGVSERNDALSLGDAATVVAAIGGAAIVGGVVLWLTAPSAEARVGLAPSAGGAVLHGVF